MTTQADLIARAKQRQQEKQHSAPAQTSATDLLDNQETVWGAILGAILGIALAAAGVAIAAGVIGVGADTQSFWYLNRASGVVAYLLLWASVAWGLLLTTRLGKTFLAAPVLLDAHHFLSNLGIGFTLFHGLILMGDQYLSFPLSAVLVPFAGDYEPVLVAAGQVGLWITVLLIASHYVRRWIGVKTWRLIHYLSFVGYWLVLVHALLLGSDSAQPLVAILYLITAAVTVFLTVYRLLDRKTA